MSLRRRQVDRIQGSQRNREWAPNPAENIVIDGDLIDLIEPPQQLHLSGGEVMRVNPTLQAQAVQSAQTLCLDQTRRDRPLRETKVRQGTGLP